MTKAERYYNIIKWFEENVPIAESELHYDSPFHLLIAVILSAQCTDKRVNMVTPDIFVKYPDAKALASTTFEELFPLVRSISYPNSKARHLIAMAQMLSADFGGEVPSDIDDLMKLPGVGRKTANVIASIVYDKPVIAVDTHVFRVAHRLAGKCGQGVGKPHSGKQKSDIPSLAHPAGTIHLHGTGSALRQMRTYGMVPGIQ